MQDSSGAHAVEALRILMAASPLLTFAVLTLAVICIALVAIAFLFFRTYKDQRDNAHNVESIDVNVALLTKSVLEIQEQLAETRRKIEIRLELSESRILKCEQQMAIVTQTLEKLEHHH